MGKRSAISVITAMSCLALWGCGSNDGGGAAGGGPPSGDAQPATLGLMSFNVTAKLSEQSPRTSPLTGDQQFTFTARFAHDGAWSLVLAGGAVFSPLLLQPAGEDYAVSEASLPSPPIPTGDDCASLSLSSLVVTLEAPDGDAPMSGFHARGKGLLAFGCTDTPSSQAVEVELNGTIDAVLPTLALPASTLSPLVATEVTASEALDGSSALTLTPVEAPTQHVTVSHVGDDDTAPFWSFVVPPLLAFDAKRAWQADLLDLAGNAQQISGEISTVADPGILPDDGFESDVPASSLTPVQLVSDGALEGSRSLSIGSGIPVMFHLEQAGATTLRFAALAEPIGGSVTLVVRVGVLGGSKVVEQQLTLAANDANAPATATTFEIALPEAGDDVVVSLSLPPLSPNGPIFNRPAALIDHLGLDSR